MSIDIDYFSNKTIILLHISSNITIFWAICWYLTVGCCELVTEVKANPSMQTGTTLEPSSPTITIVCCCLCHQFHMRLNSFIDARQPNVKRVKTLRPRQNYCHFADDIFKCNFVDQNVWILLTISLKFVPRVRIYSNLALVQIMAWCLTKASEAERWSFQLSAPEQTVEMPETVDLCCTFDKD